VAFVGIATSGSTSVKLQCIWSGSAGHVALVTKKGDAAPGCPAGTVFSGFTSISLPDQGGVVILANISGLPGAKQGIWAVDTGGTLRLVIREGDWEPTSGKTIKKLTFMPVVKGVSGQTRGFSQDTGDIAYFAQFTDGSFGICTKIFP
jgi:hypothetical protein